VTRNLGFSGNTFNIGVLGAPGTAYILQTTTNLLGVWTPLQTNTTDGAGVLNFADSSATNAQQFYRLVH
jgi:hypothetical protein